MIALATISIVGLLVALLLAALVYVIARLIVPEPIPLIAAVLIFVIALIGGIDIR